MKNILIFLGLIFLGIYGFGKYQDYQRYNSNSIKYSSSTAINENHYNQELVLDYRKAIEELNSFVKMQWFTEGVDVLKPEGDDLETIKAVRSYEEKLSKVKYYEGKLTQSNTLKEKGLTAEEIQAVFENNLSPKEIRVQKQKELLRELFKKEAPLRYGTRGGVVFEIQKLLNIKGYEMPLDGQYNSITIQAVKSFQEKNNLFPDGKIGVLTFEALLQ